jgi:tRNA U34 5-carboxymethylaminomethyl modifying GTPase MnmE/TrmE
MRNLNYEDVPESYRFTKEERISKALGRKVNFYHERKEDILNELLTKVEQYQTEYQDTVGALREHLNLENQKKEECYQILNRYKQAKDYVKKAITTQHCTMNHMENTEYEKGQINGLIQASNILNKAFKEFEEDGK